MSFSKFDNSLIVKINQSILKMPAACFVTAANNDEEGSGLFGGRRERDILWRDICWVDKSHKEEKEPLAGVPSYVLTPSNPLTDVGLFRMAPDHSKSRWVGTGCRGSGYLPEGCRPLLQGTPDVLNTWEVDGKRKYFTDYPRIPDELNDQKVPAGEATKRSVLATWLYIRGEKQDRPAWVDGSCDGRVRSWFEEDVIQFILGVDVNLRPYIAMYTYLFDVDDTAANIRRPGVNSGKFPKGEKHGVWSGSPHYRWVRIEQGLGFCYVKGLPILEGVWMATFKKLAGMCGGEEVFGSEFAKNLAEAVQKIVSSKGKTWDPVLTEPEPNPLEDKLYALELEFMKMKRRSEVERVAERRDKWEERIELEKRLNKKIKGLEDSLSSFRGEMDEKIKRITGALARTKRSWWSGLSSAWDAPIFP